METRANFILIGAFTLLGIIGTLGFFVWLSSVQLDRQYKTYGILFNDVSGLDASGDVVFNGIGVGRVIDLRIYDADPSKVYVGVEVDANTPVRGDTVAQLSSSGVTGVSYVSLSNTGRQGAPLTAKDGQPPIIASKRSSVQQLVEDAPDLLSEATKLLEQFQIIAGPDNQAYVGNILRNLDAASGGLEKALSDFSEITGTVGDATAEIARFTKRLETLGPALETTLANADKALNSATGAFESVQETVTKSSPAIDSAGAAFAQAEAIMRDDIPGIVEQIGDTVEALNVAISDISLQGATTLSGFENTADLLNARLGELEKTLTEADTAFVAVTDASNSFDKLVYGAGTLLVSEARAVLADAAKAIGTIESVVNTDVPAVVQDIRTAVSVATQAIDRVAKDVTGLTGKFDPLADEAQNALVEASETFKRTRATLDTIDGSLAAADGALASAQTTFDAATEALSIDLGPALADLRSAAARIENAAGKVSDDMPAITADLRNLIARADKVVAQVQTTVGQAAPGIRDFTGTGLSELTRLGGEARSLVRTLEQLVRRVERDPARFLLDDRVPEYRR